MGWSARRAIVRSPLCLASEGRDPEQRGFALSRRDGGQILELVSQMSVWVCPAIGSADIGHAELRLGEAPDEGTLGFAVLGEVRACDAEFFNGSVPDFEDDRR
jgi:hypothetical protein